MNTCTDKNSHWKIFSRDSSIRIKSIIDSLKPKKITRQYLSLDDKSTARPNTLSSRYGQNEFPFHTDFATSDTPANYIILATSRPRKTKTLLIDTNELIDHYGIDFLKRCLFIQKDQIAKYRRLVTMIDNKPRFCYNPAIMTPHSNEAIDLEQYMKNNIKKIHSIDWTEKRIALLDNWNVLHARECCTDPERVGIYRYSIWK